MKYQAMTKLLLLLLLMAVTHGVKSQGFSKLMVIPSISPDTLLVMDKEAAIIQANKILSFEARLNTCLSRESALNNLWYNTEVQLETQKQLNSLDKAQIKNLLEQLELRAEEKELILKQAKKERFKTLLIAGGVGVGVGAILMGLAR